MPWTVEDVDSHKKGLSAEGKKKWVSIANSVYNQCIREGGTDKTCAPSAIRIANSQTRRADMKIATKTVDVKHFWVEKNVPYTTWAIIEAFPGGVTRSPFDTKEEAIKHEYKIAEGLWDIKQVPSPQEKYPKQYEALKKLEPYNFVEYHSDGDLTIQELIFSKGKPQYQFKKGRLIVVTIDGMTFEEVTYNPVVLSTSKKLPSKSKNKAYIIKIDGSEEQLKSRPSLKESQTIVDGYITLTRAEELSTKKKVVLVVDEEGLLKGKPLNKGVMSKFGRHLVGDVIVLEGWRSVGN